MLKIIILIKRILKAKKIKLTPKTIIFLNKQYQQMHQSSIKEAR